MNSNLFHNILNVVIALLAALTAFLIATGCSTLPSGVMDCSKSWIGPEITSLAVMVLGVMKTVVNIFRDGFGGLIKPQPPVK